MNGDGVYIRPPSEILNNWTYLDVYEAHAVMNWNADVREYDRKKREKEAARSPGTRKPKR